MRIAVWHNLPSGGGKRALYDHVRGLVSREHEIEAWCPPTADRSYLPLSEVVPEHVVPLSGFEDRLQPGLVRRLHEVRWNTWSQVHSMERHCRECARQMHAKRFDILFAASCILYHTPFIGRFVEIPSILYLQEPNRPFYEAQPELLWPAMNWTANDLLSFRFWRKSLSKRIRLPGIRVLAREERKSALAFDQILVNSFFSRESVLRAFGIDSRVCYLGIDTNRFANRKRPREFFAVSLGAIIPPKNVEFLVNAVASVSPHLRPTLVLVANNIESTYLDHLKVQAQKSQVSIQVHHRIKDEEIVEILNRARVMLYAPRLEPFGYAPLEACACGTPVVAVAEGGVRETIQNGVNGLLVEHEPTAMGAAIERLMRDDKLHEQLSAQAQEMVKDAWSLAPSIDRLERHLKNRVLRSAENGSSGAGDKTHI
jgi:glycosyltransferase involved in cell wall biosynthesis